MTILSRLSAALTVALMSLASFPALAQDAAALAADAEPVYGQPVNWGLGLQNGVTPVKEKMHFFHDALLLPIITAITLFVLALMIYVAVRFRAKANPVASRTTHNTLLEVVWTLVPVLILVVIVIPSMKMLYYVDRTHEAEMTLKVTGYQWYWGYEYPDHGGVNFESRIVEDKDLKPGEPRLLVTDNQIVLPVDTNIRILITANDVLHAWAMPAFGVKLDAVPGRTNETWARIEREGVYYGQCSEICGVNHGFMPIEVRAVSKDAFAAWVKEKGGTMPAPGAANVVIDNQSLKTEASPASEAKTPAEVTAEDKAVIEDAVKPGDAIDDAAKKAADPIPSEKAGE